VPAKNQKKRQQTDNKKVLLLVYTMECIATPENNKVALNVYVQPRASRTRLAGMHDNAIKISVTAPPVENKANGAVIRFFADLFGVPKSAVSIKSGRHGRHKKVLIHNIDPEEARQTLSRALSKA
jgi:uncharacterized protein (TIGR00251 family)